MFPREPIYTYSYYTIFIYSSITAIFPIYISRYIYSEYLYRLKERWITVLDIRQSRHKRYIIDSRLVWTFLSISLINISISDPSTIKFLIKERLVQGLRFETKKRAERERVQESRGKGSEPLKCYFPWAPVFLIRRSEFHNFRIYNNPSLRLPFCSSRIYSLGFGSFPNMREREREREERLH